MLKLLKGQTYFELYLDQQTYKDLVEKYGTGYVSEGLSKKLDESLIEAADSYWISMALNGYTLRDAMLYASSHSTHVGSAYIRKSGPQWDLARWPAR